MLLISCSNTPHKINSKEPFPVTSPLVIDTIYYSDYVAEIHSRRNIEVRARVKGYIEKINVDEGQKVKEGQVLFTISSQEYKEELLKAQATLKSAIAELKAAELDLLNTKKLVEKNIVSETEYEMAQSRTEALSAKVEEMRSHESSARLKLDFTQIKAPFEGVIDRIPNKIGSLIDEGTLLTTLSDNSEVYAYFNVSEKEYLDYTANKANSDKTNKISLILANNLPHAYKGEVETIEGEFNKGTGNIAFRAKFPNPEGVLRHGASGKVRLKRIIKNVMVIPQKTTFEIQDKMYVYVVDGKNSVKMKSIVPGFRMPHLYIISSGLSVNDRIIYEGIQDIKDGMVIDPQMIDLKNVLPRLGNQEI
jgi:RND family efflux transporter MFP subunit